VNNDHPYLPRSLAQVVKYMVRITFLILFLLLPILCIPAYSAQPPRPQTGIGLLTIRSFPLGHAAEAVNLILYAYPDVKRVTETSTSSIPGLEKIIGVASGEFVVAAIEKKGGWIKIAYDDAGREGWLKMQRYWEYAPWDRFLKGHFAVLLPKLPKSSYLLRKEHSENSELLETISSQRKLQIITVEDDWAEVMAGGNTVGWVHWQDADGRWMISLEEIKP
jgi:hypothetical protein